MKASVWKQEQIEWEAMKVGLIALAIVIELALLAAIFATSYQQTAPAKPPSYPPPTTTTIVYYNNTTVITIVYHNTTVNPPCEHKHCHGNGDDD